MSSPSPRLLKRPSSRSRSKSPRLHTPHLDRSKSPSPQNGSRSKSPRCNDGNSRSGSRATASTTYCIDGRDTPATPSTANRPDSSATNLLEPLDQCYDNLSSRSVSPLLFEHESFARVTEIGSMQQQRLKAVDVALQVEQENVKDVLGRLDSIRRLAGDAQVIRRKENREKNKRRLHIEMLHSLLLEEAEFNPQAVRQRNVLSMLEGINLHIADVFFFSTEDSLKNLATGPSVKLRDAIDRPYRMADRLLVDTEVLSRILSQLETHKILLILNKCVDYVTFRHTTYQLTSIEEREHYNIKNASGIASYENSLLVTDACSHCIWRVSVARATTQGNHDVELFAGIRGESGLRDGPLRRAKFHSPMGIAISAKTSEAFVVDTDNNSIRRINLKQKIVSTIQLEMSPFSAGFNFVATFDQPKGVCIISGDRNTFIEMETCQQTQIEEYKEQLERLHADAQSMDSSTSSEFEHTSGEESSSTSSSASSSSSANNSNGEVVTKARSVSFCRKSVQKNIGERRSTSPGKTIPDTKHDGLAMSLEQSLTYERLKKYTVLTQPTIPSRAREKLACPVQGPNSSLMPAMHAQLRRVQSRRPSLTTEHTSAMYDIRDKAEVSPVEVRLAVTSDHCIWFVNPYTGHAVMIAGHPMQYGYGDARLGLQARFSAPKGILHIRSVLFVADYWNNVIRSVNLYTTQVDTIVDFSPQGPVALSLSDSGVLYCLDSDNIHYANILRIMSTQRGGDDGSISTPLIVEDKWCYQTLFSQPRTRACSSDPSRRPSAFSQAPTEVWDSYKASIWTDKVEEVGGCIKGDSADKTYAGSADFKTRLQAHLQQAAEDQQETKRKVSKKQASKPKRKIKVSESDNSYRIITPYTHTPYEKHHEASSENAYIDSRLLPSQQSKEMDGDPKSVSPLEPKTSEQIGENSGHAPECNPQVEATTPEINSTTDTLSPPKSPSVRKSSKRSGLRSPMADGRSSPRPPKSPQAENDTSSEGQVTCHVQRAKLRLSQMEVLQPYRDDLPMTLRDVGIFEERRKSRGKDFSGAPQAPWSAPGNYGMMNQSLNLNQVVYNSNSFEYRVMEGSSDGPTPDAGTIMVSGGKAYYRERTGQDKSAVTSWNPSRRGSAEELVRQTGKRVLKGEDEDGCIVNFVDLLPSSRRSSDVCDQKAASVQVQDLTLRLAAIQTTQTGFPMEAGMSSSRRSSRLSFVAAVNAGGMSNTTSRRTSNQSISLLSRRASNQSVSLLSRKQSITSVQSRRESIAQMESRRNSRRDSNIRRLSDDSRRNSEIFAEGGPRRSLVSGSRKISFSDASVVNPDMPRKSQGVINAFGSGEDNVARPSLSLSRRNSLHLNIMPTLVDAHEEEDECDNDTNSGSSSEKSVKAIGISGGGCASSKQASEVGQLSYGYKDPGSSASSRQASEVGQISNGCKDPGSKRSSKADPGSKRSSKADPGSKRSSKAHTARSSTTSFRVDTNNGTIAEFTDPFAKLCSETVVADDIVPPEASNKEHGKEESKALPEVVKESLGNCRRGVQDDITTATPEDLTHVSVCTPVSPSMEMTISLESPKESKSNDSNAIMTLEQVPFTRDIDVVMLENRFVDQTKQNDTLDIEARQRKQSVFTTANTVASTYKVTAAFSSKTWRMVPLPGTLSAFERVARSGQRKYPNTPLSMVWYEDNTEVFLFVGLLVRPHLVKIIPPKHHEPDKNGRFNALPIDTQQVLIADEASHQIRLLNHQYGISKHLAGCGKRGYLDGPLETCRMHSPCSMTLDPRSHFIYVADRGNHAIRKIDLMSGLMSTVVGNGTRGNCDGSNPRQQTLDSPFEVSFVEPHYLIISCADNSIRSFNLRTTYLETILVGS